MTALTTELEQLKHTVFADVDMVLHAGDITELEILQAFSPKEVVAVSGNMDSRAVRSQLPSEEVLEIEGVRIGMVHGWGHPFGMSRKIGDTFGRVDAIVYGHTHRADNKVRDGILFFNPGAYCGGFPFFLKRSVGILTIKDGKISGEIIKL
jgi:putative phosphoesterase